MRARVWQNSNVGKSVKLALAQINPIVGDIRGNVQKLQTAAEAAQQLGADLLIAPELAVCGYPPKDLLLREGFVARCDDAVLQLAKSLPSGLAAIIGHPTARDVPDGRIANAASLLKDNEVEQTIHKTLLPNYDVFDEERYFRPSADVQPMEFQGVKLGVHICEDAWWGQPNTTYHDSFESRADPIDQLYEAGAKCFINLSASPFEKHKPSRREDLIRAHIKRVNSPFVFVNQCGGNDDLVFDGNSFVLDASGQLCLRLAAFENDLQLVDLAALSPIQPEQPVAAESELLDALILGLRDYMSKCGFTDCVLGLSGGIDSTLACYIAAKAVGAQHVHGIAMPSRYSSEHSVSDAKRLAENLSIDYEEIPIDAMHSAFENTPVVGADLKSQPAGLADQNLQARIRGNIVMARSNRNGWIALATGNKSELAVGYCTLYGDMAGGFAVLCDIFKRDVYAISRYINEVREGREVLPDSTITKPPSAELAPDQFDQDTLPPYPVLDAILEGLIEREESRESLCDRFDEDAVNWVSTRLDRNEFKRRQMPPGIKLSARAFGSGRRMPMAARFE
jgi:NAD+ synthase (glutamine-hydrolysing)